jgi:hypothetical protein
MDALSPYLKNDDVKHCPAVQVESKKDPTLFGYAFNSKLSGVDSSKVINPTEVPLLYDSINLARNASDPVISLPDPPRMHGQNRSNIMAYADSHAKRLRVKEANQ